MPKGKGIVGAVKEKAKKIIKGVVQKNKARKLMESAHRKKMFAYDQEKIGNAQIKNKTQDPFGRPVGKERLARAAKARKEATRDSTMAVKLNPKLVKKKK